MLQFSRQKLSRKLLQAMMLLQHYALRFAHRFTNYDHAVATQNWQAFCAVRRASRLQLLALLAEPQSIQRYNGLGFPRP